MKGLTWVGFFVAVGIAAGAIGFALTPARYRAVTTLRVSAVDNHTIHSFQGLLNNLVQRAFRESRMEGLMQDLNLYQHERATGRSADAMLDLRRGMLLSRRLTDGRDVERWTLSFDSSDPNAAERASLGMASLILAEFKALEPQEPDDPPSFTGNFVEPFGLRAWIIETTKSSSIRPRFLALAGVGAAAGLFIGLFTMPPGSLRQRWLIVWALVGGLGGWQVSTTAPRVFRAQTRVGTLPPGDGVKAVDADIVPAEVALLLQQAHSQWRLEEIIRDYNLYESERRTHAMTDVVALMRRDTIVGPPQMANRGTVSSFTLGFQHPDPRTAVYVTERLASVFIIESVDPGPKLQKIAGRFQIREGARLPDTPVSPRLLPHLAIGSLAGLFIGLALSRWHSARLR